MSTTARPLGADETVVVRESATTLPLPAKHVSWGAVIAGMVIAVVVHLVLGLVGAGVGLGAFDPLGYSSPDATAYGIGAGVWWAVSSVIALFLGGWVAGHLCGSLEKTDAVLHGLLTWALATIVTVYLITAMVSSVVRGGAAIVGKAADLAGSGSATAAAPAIDAVRSTLPAASQAPAAQQRAELEARSRQVAGDAASVSSAAALAAAGALALGAVAGALGGMAGRRKPRRFVGTSTATVTARS
jgi:hypothetical protein